MKLFNQIRFDTSPILFAAWPGMGNVGLIAMDYLRRLLDAQVFAEIDMSPFFAPESIIVQNGIAQLPELPSGIFHYHFDPDLIIFESNAQISGKDGIAVIKTILDLAVQFKVKRIYTAAAFARPMSHLVDSAVLCTSNTVALLDHLRAKGLEPMMDGQIAGLNGLMLAIAATREIESACLLGTIPSYATNIAYPKASLAIMRTIEILLDMIFDLTELENGVEVIDKQLGAIEERIRNFFPTFLEQESEIPDIKDDDVPEYIMQRIEQLFEIVRKDKGRAPELKDELVRWNLFELYENRFLDLFKNENGKK
jgi:proteasome assembly chaperone (PAC2) family protein